MSTIACSTFEWKYGGILLDRLWKKLLASASAILLENPDIARKQAFKNLPDVAADMISAHR